MTGNLPALFRFDIERAVEGRSFAPAFVLLAVAVSAILLLWFLRLAGAGGLDPLDLRRGGLFLPALAMMGYLCWGIAKSRSGIDVHGIYQNGLSRKRIDFPQMVSVRLWRVAGFDWLIAPRVVVRKIDGKFAAVFAADRQVLDVLVQIAAACRHWRDGTPR